MPQAKNTLPRPVFRMGKDIYLSPFIKEDAPHFFRWVNDPEVTQFVTINLPMSLSKEEQWIEDQKNRQPHDIVLAVVLKKGHRVIGSMGLHNVNFVDGTASTGSIIGDKTCWGKGYGTQAKTLLLDYTFNTLGLRKVYSSVIAYNKRSKRCLEKCGYHEEGRRKLHFFRNGRYHDEILMAIFKTDFLKLTRSNKK